MTLTDDAGMQAVLHAIHARRAVRSYAAQPVERRVIEQLLDAAVHAPTAMHQEPWAFAIVQDKARLRRYSDRAKAMLLDQGHTSHSLVLAPDPHPERTARMRAMLSDPAFNIFYDAGSLVVICRTSAEPFAEADCWLAAENLMLAATAMGLATCCIGFALTLLNQPDIRRELGIPEAGAAVAPLIVGVPAVVPAPVPRRPPQILAWLGGESA
jgi:nitroreductase